MTMVDGPTGFVLFRDEPAAGGDGGPRASAADNGSANYFRGRERAERAAAKVATSSAARHLHQELAQHYARLADKFGA